MGACVSSQQDFSDNVSIGSAYNPAPLNNVISVRTPPPIDRKNHREVVTRKFRILDLPDKILLEIFRQMGAQEVLHLSMLSRKIKEKIGEI
ncbi:hypothetical protein L5515_005537 [Caenorhabditis briggsae]|uniref:F-box domain-containing protein n=1 Tax=Caenorhabditis briggsae TaxID=6238 RepID=A0AAE9EKL5_CAEBR|nr:hypothetical protein L5515_005537 [Caenorhabditis briggsae]